MQQHSRASKEFDQGSHHESGEPENQIKKLEKRSDFWKYAAIVGGSVALSASTYILIK